MMRRVPAARRSLVTVSAMPDDSQPNSRSVLTLVKSMTAMAGGFGSTAACTAGSGGA